MTLNSFEKVNVETRNEYNVFDASGNYVETFYKDFLDRDNNCFSDDRGHRDWDKLSKYGKATVKHVGWNNARRSLSITIIAK